MAFRDADLSEDAFLGGALKILQPKKGYRAATDPVLLAAACRAQPGDRVLDVGCGVGAAGFCLAKRTPGLSLEGIELQEGLVELSRRNAARNGVGSWLAHAGDIRDAPLFVRSARYDHVITNPPYFEANSGAASPNAIRDAAHRESADMAVWMDFCLRRLAPGGGLTVIQRIERLPDILAALAGRAGGATVLPLAPFEGERPKRAILRAVKESRAPFALAPPFVLHDGAPGQDAAPFTASADAVLRRAEPLEF